MIGEIPRLVVFDVLRALGTWRWLAVPPALFTAGYVGADQAQYDPDITTPLVLNVWDGPLSMMADSAIVVFAFGLGFAFVTGDLYVRDLSSGTAAMTLVRSRSRTGWWVAKLCALGVLAFVYSVVGFCSALAASALLLPLSLETSPVASTTWGDPESLYPRFEGLPMPLFFIAVVLYTALSLWAVGAVILAISVVYPRFVVPLTAVVLWVIVGSPLVSPLYQREGIGTLDPLYHISYVVHFGTSTLDAMPWSTSFAIIAGTLALVMILGAWRLRQVDM